MYTATTTRINRHGQPVGPTPERCPTCFGTESEVIYTWTLEWECRDCRAARMGDGTMVPPGAGERRGQAAVEARRAATAAKAGAR